MSFASDKSAAIYVAGHKGLVGSAIMRNLKEKGYTNVFGKARAELDLLNQSKVDDFFQSTKIDYLFLAAARVGGIYANKTFIGDFLYENLMTAANVIHASLRSNVKKLLFLGSSCIYPKLAPQPMKETSLLTGPLEETNEGYAIAKISGLKLCQFYQRQYERDFISAMPTNIFGPFDNYHPDHSHVIPGILRKFHEAKVNGKSSVTLWGTGNPKREFLFSEDLAEALSVIMDKYQGEETVNVGTGLDCTIRELAELVKEVTEFKGGIEFDPSMPDGPPRKILDVSRVKKLGWKPSRSLKDGLISAYQWAQENKVFN